MHAWEPIACLLSQCSEEGQINYENFHIDFMFSIDLGSINSTVCFCSKFFK